MLRRRSIASRAKPGGARINPLVLWSPVSLFASGEQGIILDPSNLATLSQDDAGATPVTADSDPVGRILDLSPNGNHITQSTSGSRPTYKTSGGKHWLTADRVDDFLASASFAWGSDKVTLILGFQFSNNAVQMIVAFGSTAAENNSWDFSCPPSSARGPTIFRRGDSGSSGNYGNDDGWADQGSAPKDWVTTFEVDMAGTTQATENPVVRVNGAAPTTIASGGTADQAGNFGTKSFNLFRRPSGTPLYGNQPVYGLIAINRLLSLPETIQAEIWMATRAGVTLP